MAWMLALGAAGLWGVIDFAGGLASRKVTSAVFVFWQAALGAVVSTVALVLIGPEWGGWIAPAGWGAAAGLGGALGAVALYHGLSVGRMSVVAALAGLVAAAVPMAVGTALGDRPSPAGWAGVAMALPAIWLLTWGGGGGGQGGLIFGVMGGLGFGISFFALGQVPEGFELVALPAVRAITATAAAIHAIRSRHDFRAGVEVRLPILAVGIADLVATLLFIAAAQRGLISLVSVIASLYPGATIALAAIFLGERLRPPQWVGAACALGAVGLIAA
jgi:drug/metabolite transporter (DMT)-like permease